MTSKGLFLVCACLSAALTGCRSDDYRTQTILLPDGSVERTIFQPLEDIPAPAQKPELWKSKEVVKHLSRDYIKANGKFPSVKDIPDTLVLRRNLSNKALTALLSPARLDRQYTKSDFVFVTEHRWGESLTDTVTIASLRQGREELLVLGLDLGEAVFQEVLGKEYDASELLKWLRSDGKAWVTELTDYAFMHYLAPRSARDPKSLKEVPPDVLQGLADICDRYGLHLRDKGEFIMDEAKLYKVAEDFAFKLGQKIRRRDTNKPVDRETLLAWLDELQKESKKKDDKAPPGRFEAAALKVVKEKYGFKEVLEAKAGASLLKVAGVHLLAGARKFDVTLTLPGPVVETNGEVLAGNQVRWHFLGESAWPFGYAMTCRALEPQSELQRDLLKGEPLARPEAMLDFVKVMALETPSRDAKVKTDLPTLADILKQCRTQKSLTPLHDHRQKVRGLAERQGVAEHGARLEAMDQLYKLLKIDFPGGK